MKWPAGSVHGSSRGDADLGVRTAALGALGGVGRVRAGRKHHCLIWADQHERVAANLLPDVVEEGRPLATFVDVPPRAS
jgi:hypothetical protein